MTSMLTPSEQEALIGAIQQSFGPCTCRPVNGHLMGCDGHRFLAEVQQFGGEKLVDRVSILTYYRRLSRLWTDAEFSRPFTTLEPPLPPDLIPEPNRLPW